MYADDGGRRSTSIIPVSNSDAVGGSSPSSVDDNECTQLVEDGM